MDKCAVCGGAARIEPASFEIKVFVFQGGPRKGELGYSVVPDGMKYVKCYTNEGCGESYYDSENGKLMDAATQKLQKQMPNLQSLLEDARKLVSE